MAVLGFGFGALALGGAPKHIFASVLFSTIGAGPALYWMKLQRMEGGRMNKPAGVYYLDGTTEEEIERFRHQDQIESLAYTMDTMPGFGMFNKDGRHL